MVVVVALVLVVVLAMVVVVAMVVDGHHRDGSDAVVMKLKFILRIVK